MVRPYSSGICWMVLKVKFVGEYSPTYDYTIDSNIKIANISVGIPFENYI